MIDATAQFPGFLQPVDADKQGRQDRKTNDRKKEDRKTAKAAADAAQDDHSIHPGMFLMHRSSVAASRRFVGVAATAAVITFGLFMVMQGLVDFSDGARTNEGSTFRMIDVVEDIPDVEPRFIERTIERPVDVEIPPEMPDVAVAAASDGGTGIDLSISIPRNTTRSRLVTPSLAMAATTDGDYLPLVVIQPQYPRAALERGIEGYVVIELTVSEDGSVAPQSVAVLEAKPKGIFNRSAIAAARKFKYKPKMVDGQGIAVPGVIYKFSFTINQ